MTRVEEYLKTAADCREEADTAASPAHKVQWLKLAEHWLRMADEAERYPERF